MIKANSRIAILDGFRALAITTVMFFHFFSRWTPPNNAISLYPYESTYNYFEYGKLGVQFFFIISGFVIYFTLENTMDFRTFWKKRFIRLMPSIAIASIITFFVFRLFDTSNIFPASHYPENFIPSLTFIDPQVLRNIFAELNINIFDDNFGYLSGSYWTLWQEIQFYIYSSIIYYFNREKFKRNFLLISISLILLNYVFRHVQGSNRLGINISPEVLRVYSIWIRDGFSLLSHLPFFGFGVIFYILFRNVKEKLKTSLPVKACFLFLLSYIIYSSTDWDVRMFYLGMIAIFLFFIYLPDKISFFENSSLVSIGQCSYFLYLIHEHIGVLIINWAGRHFLFLGPIFPVMVMLLLISISIFYTNKFEFRIGNWLKRQLVRI